MDNKVLLQHTAFKGSHKIQDMQEKNLFEVISQPFHRIPVFKGIPLEGYGKLKIVHNNLLWSVFNDFGRDVASEDTSSNNENDIMDVVAYATQGVGENCH